ncbi:hypothetical protein EJ04DRAFT_509349 [Polyplosphaeria fusca]|uniref:Uncharacterized protein n=1 Tax=Polyplosphaeria fusca TaxID=682080 RepID=A0A9P4R9A9_9PLEO|nr:hypothetical protein EJ04DRAFT_509349 [Polyplosphaeria fusca]
MYSEKGSGRKVPQVKSHDPFTSFRLSAGILNPEGRSSTTGICTHSHDRPDITRLTSNTRPSRVLSAPQPQPSSSHLPKLRLTARLYHAQPARITPRLYIVLSLSSLHTQSGAVPRIPIPLPLPYSPPKAQSSSTIITVRVVTRILAPSRQPQQRPTRN